nr:glycosyltransferase family 2 protein [Propioniciclava soli]
MRDIPADAVPVRPADPVDPRQDTAEHTGDPWSVSVVIPTRGRPELALAAVRSALGQTRSPWEVLLVVDGPDPVTEEGVRDVDDPRFRLLVLPENVGAGGARNAGVRAAKGAWIAFLDDDDTWRPAKLERQLAALASRPDAARTVLGTGTVWHTGRATHTWPLRAPRPGETVGEYLFVRDRAGEGMLPTPGILLPRALAATCPMPTHLRTHEEWDWMLELEKHGARFDVVLDPLVDVDARPRRASRSQGNRWRVSLAWALDRAEDLGPRAFSALVLTEVARGAAQGRAGLAAHLAIAAVALTGRPRLRDVARFLARPLTLRLGRGAA